MSKPKSAPSSRSQRRRAEGIHEAPLIRRGLLNEAADVLVEGVLSPVAGGAPEKGCRSRAGGRRRHQAVVWIRRSHERSAAKRHRGKGKRLTAKCDGPRWGGAGAVWPVRLGGEESDRAGTA